MNFSAKLTLALVAGTALFPMTAQALPSTGTTAAAVSIKFDGTSNGNFSIQPGSNASGGGTGVRELSAAVATGDTSAEAFAETTKQGTSSSANGYSMPVTFSYVSTSDVSKKYDTSDRVDFNTHQENKSDRLDTITKNSNYDNYSNITSQDDKTAPDNLTDTKVTTDGNSYGNSTGKGSSSVATSDVGAGTTSNSTEGTANSSGTTKTTNSEFKTNSNITSNVANNNLTTTTGGNNDNTSKSDVNSQSGATTNNTLKTTNLNDINNTKVEYSYMGSAAGLSYIPALGK